MPEETKQPVNTATNTTEVKVDAPSETPSFDKLVSEKVNEELKKIKSSLDNAYKERDAAKAEMAKIAKEKQDAEIAALEKAGKHSEVLKIEMDRIRKELDTYKTRNTELSRDNAVRSQLNALDFRNDKAAALAHADIIKSLRQDTNGNWMHESGLSIEEAVQLYAKDEKNSFMFSVKANVGSGTPSNVQPTTGKQPVKSIKEMSQAEVLKAIEDGTLTPKGNWSL
jgi:hypothetical protein